MDVRTIKIGVGLGDVRFGILREDAKRLLGEPDDILAEGESFGGELWVYERQSVALGFQSEDGYRLGSIEVKSPDATLSGVAVIGLPVHEAALALRDVFSFPLEAVFDDGEEPEQLRFRDLAISFWVEDGTIESISWSVTVNETDELLWPDPAAD